MIHTDPKRIYTDKPNADLLYGDLTYKVRGAFFNVYNELGFGHKEQVYQKSLMQEFTTQNILFKREINIKVRYKGEAVGNYRPDFIIDNKIVVEVKAVEWMVKSFETQLLNYLKSTGFKLGILVNFGSPNLYIKRLIY